MYDVGLCFKIFLLLQYCLVCSHPKNACPAFFSDLCTAFGAKMLPLLDVEPINDMLAQGRRSRTSKTKTLSNWATKEVRKLKLATSSW
jgi:importin subunit beta-1